MRFAFIDVEKTSYPMRILCRVLKVSLSGLSVLKIDPTCHNAAIAKS